MYGPGVERVYDEVKDIFNDKKIKIFSSDYLESKNTEGDMIDLSKDIMLTLLLELK